MPGLGQLCLTWYRPIKSVVQPRPISVLVTPHVVCYVVNPVHFATILLRQSQKKDKVFLLLVIVVLSPMFPVPSVLQQILL